MKKRNEDQKQCTIWKKIWSRSWWTSSMCECRDKLQIEKQANSSEQRRHRIEKQNNSLVKPKNDFDKKTKGNFELFVHQTLIASTSVFSLLTLICSFCHLFSFFLDKPGRSRSTSQEHGGRSSCQTRLAIRELCVLHWHKWYLPGCWIGQWFNSCKWIETRFTIGCRDSMKSSVM